VIGRVVVGSARIELADARPGSDWPV